MRTHRDIRWLEVEIAVNQARLTDGQLTEVERDLLEEIIRRLDAELRSLLEAGCTV